MTQETQILQEKIGTTLLNNQSKISTNLAKFENISKNMNDNIITLNGTRPWVYDNDDENNNIDYE
jgi:hypothetical protein